MTTQFKTKRASQTLFIVLISYLLRSDTNTGACTKARSNARQESQYQVSNLPTLGGTSSGGNSINDQSWVAGYSRLTGIRTGTLRCGETVLLTRPRHTWRTKQQCHMEREEYRGHHRGYFSDCRSGASRGGLE